MGNALENTTNMVTAKTAALVAQLQLLTSTAAQRIDLSSDTSGNLNKDQIQEAIAKTCNELEKTLPLTRNS